MQLTQEEDFPRGGRASSKADGENGRPRIKLQKQENLFGFNRKKEPKKKKSKRQRAEARKNRQEEDEVTLSVTEPQILKHNTIKTDMIILGNVRCVSTVAVEIELPGRIYGSVNIGAISDILTERLKKQLTGENQEEQQELLLRNFFEVGQFLPVKVLKVEAVEKGVKVDLSTKPIAINADLSHTTFRKGMLLWATVAEKLDHGYRLDVGVQNVRTFLQTDKVPEGSDYKIGQNIWCVVSTCNIAPSATTLKVSALQKHVDSAVENDQERSLHSVLPGMQFNFDVTRTTKNGLLGELLDEIKAYVHDMYLQTPLQNIQDFQEGQELKGRVLYVEPITKFVFLTLRGIGVVPKCELKIGQIISAKVLGKTSGGIYLQLNENEKGFVTFKRILNSLGKETFEDVIDLVNEKYPKGKSVQCRILDYNRLDSVYICSVEAAVLNEKYFTKEDLVLGQLVTAEVTEVKDAGLVVKFGHLQGFIDNLHLSNAQYTGNIKNRFRVGQKVKARVLCVKKSGSIRLTIKPALIESDLCLSSPDQAETGKVFPGVVIKRGNIGALIVFYGDVTGFVHSSRLLPEAKADARDLLFDGQVVNVTIIGKSSKGIDLSLIPIKEENLASNKFVEKKQKLEGTSGEKRIELQIIQGTLKIGEEVSGTITSIQEKGLLVNVVDKNVQAFLPLHHLSVNYDLNPTLLKNYSINEKLDNLLCVASDKNGPLVSLRESIAYSKLNLSMPTKLKCNDLIRGSFIAKDDRSIRISVPTKNGSRTFQIEEADLGINVEDTDFVEQQGVMAKVASIGKNARLSAKFNDVFDYTVETSLQILEQYLSNVQKIYMHLADSNHPLTKLNLGQKISGVVKRVQKQGGCSLLLNNQIQGIVAPQHCTNDIKQGKKVTGVVLWIDYVKGHVEVSLNPKIIHSISDTQDGIIDESFVCTTTSEIILIKENFALCTSNLNKQLVFIPLKVHENDFTNILLERYKTMVGRKLKLSLYKKAGGRIMGFVNSIETDFTNATEQRKRKLQPEELISKKRKLDHETPEVIYENDSNKRKAETANNEQPSKKYKSDVSIPSMADFFALDVTNKKQEDSSSDDETAEDSQNTKKQKKKKLTAAERAELARQEEEKIREIENDLANPEKVPETAEQFDRLVLANPNSSKIWAQYIAFHLSTAEVEKARAVVKRALETIHMDKIQDKLNVWIAYLNLENLFGTKDSFEKVFEEATKYNEPYNIYLETIRMFADAKKYEEMEEKMKKFRGKFKAMPKTWIEMAKVYYEMEKFDEARKLREGALKSITDKKQHVDMLVQFAIMEFKYGEQNQGEVLFETILSSYPGRVDVWSSYVDQLVKKGCIDLARRVLERATSQRLSLMKMRSVFKKFRDFEKAHGTEESLQQVKDALVEYVARVKSNVQT